MAVLNHKHGGVPPDAVSIMRPGPWGNPFPITPATPRAHVLWLHARWLIAQIRSGALPLADLAALHGRDLVCCCAPARCHGHTLEAAAAWAHARLGRG